MKKQISLVGIVFLTLLVLLIVVPVKANTSITVSIDIKPGSCPNSINPGSRGLIPVAILTTPDFDATTVDRPTVVFAGALPLRWTVEDVWGGDGVPPDGDLDLLLFFKTQECSFSGSSASLTGETFGGQPFSGTGSINLVP